MKRLRADSRGFAFSLDILLALIPLTIILGMAVANMDNIMYLSENTIYQSSLDRTAADAADALVETSGVPYNWEKGGIFSVVGLASYDESKNLTNKNILDPLKVAALNQTQLQTLIGSQYGAYLTITTVNGTNSKVIKTVGTYNNSSSNIVRIQRFVSSSNLKSVVALEGLVRATGQPRTYTTSFPTNNVFVASYDYWVYVANKGYDSAKVDINSTQVVSPSEINQHVTEVKHLINPTILANQTNFIINPVSVTTSSNPGAVMDVYIIVAPKGTPESDINLENIKIRNAKLELYVWTR